MTGLFVFGFSVNCHHGIQDLFSELTGKYSFSLGESRTLTLPADLPFSSDSVKIPLIPAFLCLPKLVAESLPDPGMWLLTR